uniref:Penicillin-binding protein transpeptidase domain-containing protein n=1 Tax=Biomphalaria glabrata TaxID=6526 RepID=A0A2C9M2E7_BIOGL
MTMEEIFLYSSNIGTAKIAMMMGFETQYYFLKKLGFFDQLSLEINEKAIPILPKDRIWSDVVVSTISYGHGISVTPVHLVEGFSSIIGNGRLCKMTLVKGKNDNNTREKIFSDDTVFKMRYLLGRAVTHGTGKKAMINGYSIGGKTGSADKVISGMYNKNKVVTSFVAGFPIVDPKYVVLVMLDEPKSISGSERFTGGHLSAPIVKDIITEIAPMLGVSPLNK